MADGVGVGVGVSVGAGVGAGAGGGGGGVKSSFSLPLADVDVDVDALSETLVIDEGGGGEGGGGGNEDAEKVEEGFVELDEAGLALFVDTSASMMSPASNSFAVTVASHCFPPSLATADWRRLMLVIS